MIRLTSTSVCVLWWLSVEVCVFTLSKCGKHSYLPRLVGLSKGKVSAAVLYEVWYLYITHLRAIQAVVCWVFLIRFFFLCLAAKVI